MRSGAADIPFRIPYSAHEHPGPCAFLKPQGLQG